VIITVTKQAPAGPGPSLPGPAIRIAHSLTGDACGGWSKYSLSTSILLNSGDIIDQPIIGQDRNAFLFGGAEFSPTGTSGARFVAFAEPKTCAYTDVPGCDFPIFSIAHYAAPVSAGGNPMISTTASYFVASVPNVGYELYRMDNAANPASTTITLQSTVGLPPEVQSLTRNAGQPGAPLPIDLGADEGADVSTRIKSTPTFDGTRIWFTHTTSVSNHAVVRYGAINVSNNTETDALVLHSPSSDDFNPSIAVGLNGNSRTIFLSWAYTDVPAGVAVSDAVAEVTVNSTDKPPVINGRDIKIVPLIYGGITSDDRFGDYSSTVIDPLNFGQVCAVTAQEYFSKINGKWATYISRFGAPDC
jgi:hypothetical protein